MNLSLMRSEYLIAYSSGKLSMTERLLQPLSNQFNIALVPASPGVDLEEYAALIRNHFHKKRASCRIVKNEHSNGHKPHEYSVYISNQNLDAWSMKCIDQSDVILFISKSESPITDIDFINQVNSIPLTKNQQKWHCIEGFDSSIEPSLFENLKVQRQFVLDTKYYEPLLRALSTKDTTLHFFQGEDRLVQIALYDALQTLRFDIASFHSCEKRSELALSLASGISPLALIHRETEQKSGGTAFWSRASKEKIEHSKGLSLSPNVSIDSMVNSFSNSQIKLLTHVPDMNNWESLDVSIPNMTKSMNQDGMVQQFNQLRDQLIRKIIILEKSCSLQRN